MTKAAVEVPTGVLFLRMRRDQRGVQVDHHLTDVLAGRPRPGQLGAGQLPAHQPGPVPRISAGQSDLGEYRRIDAGQDPPDRRGRRHRPG